MGLGVIPNPSLGHEMTHVKGVNDYVYILLIMIFYSCLAGGLILAYTCSHKLVEAKDEPSQPFPQHQWASGGTLALAAETATKPPAEGHCQLAIRRLPTLAQGTPGV
ncbi:potassium voltage-gated channel subfamily E regulatory beta subunit 5 [Phyllostomus discolor]|uniref:Potassium voltage-gated channel subfamily E regulatory beta subunit 5 n=1 Tax=Phyllostomus discolor TaxID=89673 RepID=A0A6J2MGK1_9CHIR|nr:potassium voltage-gated channel subfamily E regulatory beta subunit 5 [Phyllostomus discolor]